MLFSTIERFYLYYYNQSHDKALMNHDTLSMIVVDQSNGELLMVRGDTCPHANRVGVITLTIDSFFFRQREWSSSGNGRLVGSGTVVTDMLLLRRGNKACSGEHDHT